MLNRVIKQPYEVNSLNKHVKTLSLLKGHKQDNHDFAFSVPIPTGTFLKNQVLGTKVY